MFYFFCVLNLYKKQSQAVSSRGRRAMFESSIFTNGEKQLRAGRGECSTSTSGNNDSFYNHFVSFISDHYANNPLTLTYWSASNGGMWQESRE